MDLYYSIHVTFDVMEFTYIIIKQRLKYMLLAQK